VVLSCVVIVGRAIRAKSLPLSRRTFHPILAWPALTQILTATKLTLMPLLARSLTLLPSTQNSMPSAANLRKMAGPTFNAQ
jgi:hypothetical protein